MKTPLENLLALNDEACALCAELTKTFEFERRYLIEFKTDELQENNLKKEDLLRDLSAKRFEVKSAASLLLPASLLDSSWKLAQAKWLSHWEQMRTRCEENQNLIRHSLRNLDMISDNLMRLLGQLTLYNNKGSKIDLSVHKPSGTVVEGAY